MIVQKKKKKANIFVRKNLPPSQIIICLLLKKCKALTVIMREKGGVFFLCLWGHASTQNTWVIHNCSVLYRKQWQTWRATVLACSVLVIPNDIWDYFCLGIFFHRQTMVHIFQCCSVCSKVQNVYCIARKFLYRSTKRLWVGIVIPVTFFIVFHFYLILTDLFAMLIADSALPSSMLLILLLMTSFSSLFFCTWCCFFQCWQIRLS